MIPSLLEQNGLRSTYLRWGAICSGALCLSSWIRAKGVDQSERGHAEHRAIFIGLWAPTLWVVSHTLQRREHAAG